MTNYKIKVRVEIVPGDEPALAGPVQGEDGTFELNITPAQACSIDDCEQALLQANYPAIREAIAKHLSELSKKKPRSTGKSRG